jgi:hypothetical protein
VAEERTQQFREAGGPLHSCAELLAVFIQDVVNCPMGWATGTRHHREPIPFEHDGDFSALRYHERPGNG